MDALTVIGAIASLGGAGISIWQASLSRTAAEETKRVRAQLIDQRKVSELSHVQAVCRKALKSMEKYGPGSVPSSLAGISPKSDASDIQDMLVVISEHRAHFGNKAPNKADEFCGVITPILDRFAQSTEPPALRQNGTEILIHLMAFMPDVKRALEDKRETVR